MRKPLLFTALLSLSIVSTEAHDPKDPNKQPRDDTKTSAPITTGTGDLTFTTVPNWGSVPDKVQIGPTHGGVVVDKAGLIYVSSDSNKGIFVFDDKGTLVKNIGLEFGGIHGMNVREENGEEFIYAAHLAGRQILKLKLDGTAVLKIPYPKESGKYGAESEYSPTAVAVSPAGDIFVADGYGKNLIHKFDSTGKYVKTFGAHGAEPGQFQTPHGLGIDTRFEKPLLLVCDRANRRLQHFDFDGNFVGVITTDLRLPCAVSVHGEHVAIAELEGRVAIIDKTNKVVSVLGDNPDAGQRANFELAPADWKPGFFSAPHGLSYDKLGNIYVQDWNKTGRVTKLVRAKK